MYPRGARPAGAHLCHQVPTLPDILPWRFIQLVHVPADPARAEHGDLTRSAQRIWQPVEFRLLSYLKKIDHHQEVGLLSKDQHYQ